MALGLTTTSGDFTPIVKYDARAGKFFRIDKEQSASGEYQTNIIELHKPVFLADMRNIEIGWIGFPDGKPDMHLVPVGQPKPPKPSDAHREGFRVLIKLSDAQSGGQPIRHFSHSANVVCKAFDLLHDTFITAPEAANGLVPVIQITDTVAVASRNPKGSSTNYAPVFTIVKWVPRPPDFDKPEEAESEDKDLPF